MGGTQSSREEGVVTVVPAPASRRPHASVISQSGRQGSGAQEENAEAHGGLGIPAEAEADVEAQLARLASQLAAILQGAAAVAPTAATRDNGHAAGAGGGGGVTAHVGAADAAGDGAAGGHRNRLTAGQPPASASASASAAGGGGGCGGNGNGGGGGGVRAVGGLGGAASDWLGLATYVHASGQPPPAAGLLAGELHASVRGYRSWLREREAGAGRAQVALSGRVGQLEAAARGAAARLRSVAAANARLASRLEGQVSGLAEGVESLAGRVEAVSADLEACRQVLRARAQQGQGQQGQQAMGQEQGQQAS